MSTRLNSALRYPEKIMALWTVFLLGTLFHTQLALMPLFHGMSVAESHTHEYVNLDIVFGFMLIFFLLPMISILAVLFYPTRQFRVLHFGMTLLYSVLNFSHLVLDIFVPVPLYQILLMLFLFLLGLALNLVAYQWMRMVVRHPRDADSAGLISTTRHDA